MKIITPILLLLSCLCGFAFAGTDKEEIKELEGKFIAAKGFVLVHEHQNVPKDVNSWFWFVSPSKEMANFGEAFNETDVVDGNYPMSQHQYTILTESVSASLIKVGGFAPVQWLLLVDRENPNIACKYHVNWELEFSEGLQYMIENKRKLYPSHFQSVPLCRAVEK